MVGESPSDGIVRQRRAEGNTTGQYIFGKAVNIEG
jgi:hypothetical protein